MARRAFRSAMSRSATDKVNGIGFGAMTDLPPVCSKRNHARRRRPVKGSVARPTEPVSTPTREWRLSRGHHHLLAKRLRPPRLRQMAPFADLFAPALDAVALVCAE